MTKSVFIEADIAQLRIFMDVVITEVETIMTAQVSGAEVTDHQRELIRVVKPALLAICQVWWDTDLHRRLGGVSTHQAVVDALKAAHERIQDLERTIADNRALLTWRAAYEALLDAASNASLTMARLHDNDPVPVTELWESQQRLHDATKAAVIEVQTLERTIVDDRSLTAWRAAHEALNAAGIEGEPGLVARIGALVEAGKLYEAVVNEDLADAYRFAIGEVGVPLTDGVRMVDLARACFDAGRLAGVRSKQRGWTS